MKFSLGRDGINVETEPKRDLAIAKASADTVESVMELAEALGVLDANPEDGPISQCIKCGDEAVTRRYPVFKGENKRPELADICRDCQHELSERDIKDYEAGRAKAEMEQAAANTPQLTPDDVAGMDNEEIADALADGRLDPNALMEGTPTDQLDPEELEGDDDG